MLANKRILIIRLSSIGDVLHVTPVAQSLKAAEPSCHITWLVSKTAASLLENNPYVDQVIIWSREDFAAAASHCQVKKLFALWQQLTDFYKLQHFDIVLDIHGLFLTGVIAHASKTNQRIGLSKTKELNRFFMTEQAPAIPQQHVIYRYLSILKPLNINKYTTQMTLIPGDKATAFAKKIWQQHQLVNTDKILFINPLTSWSSKNWSAASFAKCINSLDPKITIFICGARSDLATINTLIAAIKRPVINLAGQTSLLEVAALLQQADLLLTGDTGILHMAIALNTPTISLWGPTRPEQYGPLPAANHRIIRSKFTCLACHKTICKRADNKCMNEISPELVTNAVQEFFNA